MQSSLELQTYEIPNDLPKAQELCQTLVGDLEKTHKYYKQQIEFIKQQYKIALRQIRPGFISSDTLKELFDEAETAIDPSTEPAIVDEDERPNPKKRKKKKSAIPEHLPRTVIEHDVPEEQRKCASDGTELSPMGYDSKLELKYTRAKFEVIEHRYPKYGCDTCKVAPLREAPAPALIPESYASSELLAHIAVSKFCDHLPLYRQEQIFRREGVHISRQVMSEWMIKLGEALKPLIGLMHEQILDSEIVHADETPVKILTKDGVRTSHQAYMWQLSRWGPNPRVIFEFDMSRKKEVAEKLLGSYAGYVQIDGYGGYDVLFRDCTTRIRVGCMAHVIRKFKDLIAATPPEQQAAHPAKKVIKMIKALYDIEDVARPFDREARRQYRIKQGAEKMMEELMQFVADERQSVASSSPYYAALRYADEELPQINHYLKHGAIELDNNLAENAMRPFALGKKNWLFMCSEDGAQASANIYSLLITAKANRIEPHTYLTRVIKNLPHCKTIEDFEALLPN
jgi:transposase